MDKANSDGDDALLRFIERFALMLTEAGWPRMPARVFACLLCEDSGWLTAGGLASRLRVSPAAISGAVRYLIQIGLVSREREPGARTDHYRIDDDAWYEAIMRRNDALVRWDEALADGVKVLGAGAAAGRRLEESREFFAFLPDEMAQVMERWRRRQRAGAS
ncbi:MAG TPA: MarR family transcriptional regulator [Acidimicrobiales bacterium]